MASKLNENKYLKKLSLYDIENASPTFQKLITRYRTKRKDLKKKPKSIMAFVEKARYQAENMETENEYMMKELRNDRKFTQELLLLYGQRAEKHFNEINNHKEFKSKVKKNYFFTPDEIKLLKEKQIDNQNKKDCLPLLSEIIFIKKKKAFSPEMTNFTFNKENMTSNSSKNSTKMFKFYNTTSNINTMKKGKRKKKEDFNNLVVSKFTESNTFKSNKIKDDKTYFNTKTETFKDKILRLTRGNTLYKNKTNKDFHLNKLLYMNKLMEIKNDFSRTKNEFRNHFKTNDYGCNFSKLEYEYLTKKYFSS